jgi:hypothetical protein
MDFAKFPKDIYSVISKTHCVIHAKRELKSTTKASGPSEEAKNGEFIAATVNIQDLNLEEEKSRKSSKDRIE